MKHSRAGVIVTGLALALSMTGCASLNKTEEGALIGAGAGTVAGGIIGKATGSTARGAIIGAAVGGAAGAVIASRMDDQAEELQERLPNAEVERVGEGIHITFDSGILFGFDSYAVRADAAENLVDLAMSLEEFDNTEVLIVGHTDAVGDAAYNERLSDQRAASAADYLTDYGVSGARVHAVGRGETEPIATNETDSGRAMNRRVEVAIFASDDFRAEVIEEYGRGR